MTSKTKVISGAFLTIAVVAAILSYRIYEKSNPVVYKTNETLQLEFGVPVKVVKLERGELALTEKFTGTAEGISEAVVVADLTQKIANVLVKIGKTVIKGEALVELQKKSISNMSLKYEQTVMAYNDARLDLERMKNLYDTGAIPKQTLEKIQLKYDMSKSNLDAINDAVFIKSPISGTVTEIFVKEGNNVRTGMPVTKIVQTDRMQIKLNVNETEISKINVGQKCIISMHGDEAEYEGYVNEVSLSANPMTRNFEVKVIVDNPNNKIRSGMFVSAKIIIDQKVDVLMLEKEAVINQDGDQFVWIVSIDSLLSKKNIITGLSDEKYVEIISGLEQSHMIVLEGYNNIQKENQKASIIN
ncbi:MAG: efflux RND transporter periplasmic adaptor subunit [Calditrichaeota bacterium]|nr:MAG: efflux RND transporter periplasmic adaptor subunit [Calditrichota bacterium]MBL1208012.1 efflux RND transporter periplasmic adaptor subunit [Calditrichota bacterium]NOG47848.1 efflux RND transporter periplasmic adaptor subunit [Calditrichota bacterium]